ncbi:Hypothetical protein NTJ_04304 [Nesidiocoris tenuis]|uniref:SEA domain-containing protein n=1 Tax=Nesidiocoris tenuis TaxID=355587 RepID=A0ABN7AGV3_9HEMI|nr:Hypothetical protein NTJ_04304 [Nesidiocoris tenuis]
MTSCLLTDCHKPKHPAIQQTYGVPASRAGGGVMGAGGPRTAANVGLVFATGLILLTHCCYVWAIIDKKGGSDEDDLRRNYIVEDFFWSGSGDGSGDGRPDATWATTTIFLTTTILTTIYPTPVFPSSSVTVAVSSPSPSCTVSDCLLIVPTPTIKEIEPTSSVTPSWPDLPDQRYWLVTVLEANNSALELSPAVFEQRLARIYTTAFHRQQERHLGLDDESKSGKKTRGDSLKRDRREAVSVKVHKVSAGGVGGTALELIYTVRVAGKAVDAEVAAQDMKLVNVGEMTSQLGFPVLTKAEPFLKPPVSTSSTNQRDVWLIVAASISTILLVLLLLLFFLFNFTKNKKRLRSSGGKSVVVHRETLSSGKDNMGFQQDSPHHAAKGPKKDVTDAPDSECDSDEECLSGRGSQSADSPRGRAKEVAVARPGHHSHRRSSPNSYLSMPSIKAFPRGASIPGPLDNVLGPENPPLSRHSSASQDPGVLGPLVWDLHCHRVQKKEAAEVAEAEPSVGKMRRRFHELLDDAFSLFGSRSATPEAEEGTPPHIYGRAKSAVIIPVDPLTSERKLRPKTSDGRPTMEGLGPSGSSGSLAAPRGAWGSTPTSTMTVPRAPPRPLSAGPFHKPNLEPAWILSDSSLKPTDPAVPLIEAIKKELDKFPSNSSKS